MPTSLLPAVRSTARRILPFPLRLELLRLRRLPSWVAEAPAMARRRAAADERERFTHLLAGHSSPLERVAGAVAYGLQHGKEANVARAAALLDGLVVEPDRVFSHHHAVGRTGRMRGFGRGLELRDGEPVGSVGGGLCQVSNSFFWVAVLAGMRIVERHRHGLDLFPDHERTVPFGCGATVVYNYADLRFANPLRHPVQLRARVENGAFVSELWTTTDPGRRVEVAEVDHRFYRDGARWMRENRLRRRIEEGGRVVVDEEVAHNRGEVRYEPSGDHGAA